MNDGYEYAEQVGLEAAGQSVLAYLARRYRHSEEVTWRARLGAVLLPRRRRILAGRPQLRQARPLPNVFEIRGERDAFRILGEHVGISGSSIFAILMMLGALGR